MAPPQDGARQGALLGHADVSPSTRHHANRQAAINTNSWRRLGQEEREGGHVVD